MKLARWIGVAAVATVLAGCTTTTGGSSTGTASGTAPTPTPGQKLRIAVSIPAADHGWTAGVNWWAEQCKQIYPNAEFTIVTAKDGAEQTSQIENLMTKGMDGIVILPQDASALTITAKKLRDAGVFVVNVDRGFSEPVADIFIEGDNRAFGRMAAEFMNEKLSGGGKVLVLEGMQSTVNTDRVNAFKAALKPNITIAGQAAGEWNRETAYKVTQTMLVANKDIQAVWAADDDMALGVEQALNEANMKNVWIIGGGGSKGVVKRVLDKNPQFPATVTYSPNMIATGIHLCVSVLEGGMRAKRMAFMPRHMVLDVSLVTPENAEEFHFPDSTY